MKTTKKITIVGCGPGAPKYLTEAGREAILNASVVAGSPRLLKLYASETQTRIPVRTDIAGTLEAISAQAEHGKVVVLVSGDPGLSSFARPVLNRFGIDACDVLPGISSVQLAFARLGLDWVDARIISAHKELPKHRAADFESSPVVAILAGHRQARQWIADLAEAFGPKHSLVVCEDLSMPEERVRPVSLEEFRNLELSTRTVVLLIKKEGA